MILMERRAYEEERGQSKLVEVRLQCAELLWHEPAHITLRLSWNTIRRAVLLSANLRGGSKDSFCSFDDIPEEHTLSIP